MKRHSRSPLDLKDNRRRGNALILAVSMMGVLIGVLLVGLEFCKYRATELVHRSATEAAALECAKALSRIVIEDPNFGFVALTDQPPGQRMRTSNGEYLPIRGINSLVANLRHSAILARELDAPFLTNLVDRDLAALKQTKKTLADAWKDALLPERKSRNLAKDTDGKPVHLLTVASDAYARCLNHVSTSPVVFDVQLGSIAGGGRTTIVAPQPLALAEIKQDDVYDSCYVSDKNLKVGDQDFYFASTDREATSINQSSFVLPKGNEITSVVKLTATAGAAQYQYQTVACAIPPGYKSSSNRTTLMLSFPAGTGPQSKSLSDLLKGSGSESTNSFSPIGGDYPIDGQVALQPIDVNENSAFVFDRTIYDFLRSTGFSGKDGLSSTLTAFNEPLAKQDQYPNPYYWVLFYWNNKGQMEKLVLNKSPIGRPVTSEKQVSGFISMTVAQTPLQISYWDQTRNIGYESSGKHGGKPLKFDFINNSLIDMSNGFNDDATENRQDKLASAGDSPELTGLRLAVELDFVPVWQIGAKGPNLPPSVQGRQ
jgi:hypothetical protein